MHIIQYVRFLFNLALFYCIDTNNIRYSLIRTIKKKPNEVKPKKKKKKKKCGKKVIVSQYVRYIIATARVCVPVCVRTFVNLSAFRFKS